MDRTAGFYSKPSAHSAHPTYDKKKLKKKPRSGGLFLGGLNKAERIGLGAMMSLIMIPAMIKGAAEGPEQFEKVFRGPRGRK